MTGAEALLELADAEYANWHGSDPVIGEEDSISHDFVREIVPVLIEEMRAIHAEIVRLADASAASDAVIAAAKAHPGSFLSNYNILAQSPTDALAARDAEKWIEGALAGWPHNVDSLPASIAAENPYRATPTESATP